MKKIYPLLGALFVCVQVFSQNTTVPPSNISGTENYVYTREYLSETAASSNSVPQVQSVTYFDGLGRPKQTVGIRATTTGKDVVTMIGYDPLGRQDKDFLPMPQQGTTNGGIYSAATTPYTESVGKPLYGGTAPFFTKKEIENSPLERTLSTAAPGEWGANSKKVAFEYRFNTANEVKRYSTEATVWVEGRTDAALKVDGNYPAGLLYKNVVTDEDGNVNVEFKNKLGQVVLVRKMLNATDAADTYYVYNEFHDLAFVLSPEFSYKNRNAGTALLTSDTDLQELCYQYRYDRKSRLAEKKLPGKGWEYMVYDRQDRLIMTRDANMKNKGLWLFTKYDKYGRVAYTGITAQNYTSTRFSEQTDADNAGSNNVSRTATETIVYSGLKLFYTLTGSHPVYTNISKLLSVNYYDSYPTGNDNYQDNGTALPSRPPSVQNEPTLGDASVGNVTSTKGLPTASYVNLLGNADAWTKSLIWYDGRGRAIGTHSINHLGGATRTESVLDFTGVPLKTLAYHKRLKNGTETAIVETFAYDPQNRPWKHYHEVVGKSPLTLLSESFYDELGRLDHKQVGNNIQEVNYGYNVRGWLTSVNNPDNVAAMGSDVFAYRIRYNEPIKGLQTPNVGFPALQVKPRYNGNISEVEWNSVHYAGVSPRTAPYRFGYVYDGLNRLTAGFYQEQSNPSRGTYHEIISQYDLNGNIIKLKRFGNVNKFGQVQQIDDLVYNYSGNKVTRINDISGNVSGYEGGNAIIQYDDNGNMTAMPDKGISGIAYNFHNLPEQISQQNITQYLYRADGVKVRKSYTINNQLGSSVANTEYLDGFHYATQSANVAQSLREMDDNTVSAKTATEEEVFIQHVEGGGNIVPDNPTTMELSFFPTAEGFYDFLKGQYIYQYRDHLGNVRSSYAWNAAANRIDILDRNDYYPFGMNFVAAGAGAAYDPKGSPLNYKFGGKELQETGFYDFGARFYMSDIALFGTHDPLSEKTLQPYAFAYNNPVKFADPTGMAGEDASSDSGGGSETGSGGGSGGTGGEGCCPGGSGGGNQISPATFGNIPGGYDGAPREVEGAGKDDVRAEQNIQGINLTGAKYSPTIPVSGSFTLGGGGNGFKKFWDSNFTRSLTGDFLNVGVGISGISGWGTGTSWELNWILHGPEASFLPIVTTTVSSGAGYNIDATFNIGNANYTGTASEISRSMLVTNTANGDKPTIWGAGSITAGGEIGITGTLTSLKTGGIIIGGQINIGGGLPAGPVPFNGSGGVSNTYLIKDFYKK